MKRKLMEQKILSSVQHSVTRTNIKQLTESESQPLANAPQVNLTKENNEQSITIVDVVNLS